ncbi:hypothetical protein EIP91_011214 [Steccherinum ochraceum]|uniref:Uncharacterized protein n=1 Tax=Steccherinum ochraceum TaxID=92696 RepID=A0A4R0QZW7_9APHY|nr:hypothetical protein EIP91_011214 [Steccherinum ochraceum]
MPLFGRKTKHAEDANQARKDEGHAAHSNSAADNNDQYNAGNGNPGSGLNTDAAAQQQGGPNRTGGHQAAGAGAGAGGEYDGTHNRDSGGTGRRGFDEPQDTRARGSAGNNYGDNQQQTRASGPGSQSGGAAQHGSSGLREHGLRLEREAENLHQQSAEIAEAERLEQEAREHRERAVAAGGTSGADPIHRQPQGGRGDMV